MYKNLMENGWTLSQIDEMDIHFYFDLMSDQESEEHGYIDQVLF